MLRSILLIVAVGIFAFEASYAAEPSQEQTPQPTSPQGSQWGASMGFPEQILVGRVGDSKNNPIEGVMVKLFANGKLVGSTKTAASGDFELKVPLKLDADETVTIWFIPSTGNLMPKMVVLKQSAAAQKGGLFSPCIDQAKLSQQTRLDVRLLQEGEYIASLKAKGCL